MKITVREDLVSTEYGYVPCLVSSYMGNWLWDFMDGQYPKDCGFEMNLDKWVSLAGVSDKDTVVLNLLKEDDVLDGEFAKVTKKYSSYQGTYGTRHSRDTYITELPNREDLGILLNDFVEFSSGLDEGTKSKLLANEVVDRMYEDLYSQYNGYKE